MRTITVKIGKRTDLEFKRICGELRSFGFRFIKETELWEKSVDAQLVPRIIEGLRGIGVRGEVK